MMRKDTFSAGCRRARAFTLIELLVSMTVLSIIILLISQLVSSATNVTVSGRKRLDADSQARLVFDHMALDFSKMLKRNDVDYLFAKATATQGSLAKNDAMFFYSEAPAFYDDTSSSPIPRSSLALVGYRINKAYQLERLGKQLSWDGVVANSTPGGIMYLSAAPSSSATPDVNIIDPKSTLASNWSTVIGTATDSPAPYTNTPDDADYQVLAEQVCRMEICFQLTDGTYSTLPICPVAANTLTLAGGGMAPNIVYQTTGPTVKSDVSAKYAPGSRWYDTNLNRGYVCVSNALGAALWKPLGVQDVRAIVVALAILDSTSSKTVRPVSVTMDNRTFTVPKLDALAGVLADANPADIISPGSNQPDSTVPSFFTPPPAPATPLPTRLMAEAWGNELNLKTFVHDSGLSSPAAAQVRIYQRSFVLNN